MDNIKFDCFECRKDIETDLIKYEKGNQKVTCSCGIQYKITSFKKGHVNIYRTK